LESRWRAWVRACSTRSEYALSTILVDVCWSRAFAPATPCSSSGSIRRSKTYEASLYPDYLTPNEARSREEAHMDVINDGIDERSGTPVFLSV
jgi:hypothetical protein